MEDIAANEPLARFLLQSKHLNTKGVTMRAFMPDPYDNLSVSRVANLEPADIWSLGHAVIGERDCTLYGYAGLPVSAFVRHGLAVVPDEPPPGHALVIGWPNDKEDRKLIALELAADATLVLKS